MSKVSEEQLKLYYGGNFTTLKDYLNRKVVKEMPWVNTQTVTPSSANVKLIPAAVLAGTLAIGTATAQVNGSVIVAALAGAVGTGATTSISDALGNILNLVDIRDSSTNDPLVDSSNRKIWGLLQSDSSATDGDAIAAAASENLQISFVIFDSSNALALTTVNQAIDFKVNKVYAERNTPTLAKEGGNRDLDIISGVQGILRRYLTVTTAFAANEVITISTGAGAGSGVSTAAGATLLLPVSSGLFLSDGRVGVYRNGVKQIPGVDIIYNSTDSFHFVSILSIDEVILIEAPSNYG